MFQWVELQYTCAVPNDHSRTITKFPMKMRSGKTYTKNTTSPLNLCYILKRGLDLSSLKIWGLLVKGLTSCQIWRSQEKACQPAPAPLEPVGADSSCTGVKSFSKFDGR